MREKLKVESHFPNSMYFDAFGRLRVSNPETLFAHSAQYDKGDLFWVEKIVGTASSTHQPNESVVDLTVGTDSGDRIVRQTREYHRYQPGRSQLIKMTGALQEAKANVVKLVGYGDDSNGLFFGQDDQGIFVLLRSKTSGTVSDSRKVYQKDWNVDRMDGGGPSDLIIDFTKALIFLIDLEWLGVGRARMALVVGGQIYTVHEFLNSGLYDTTYMTTANLPVRYEIKNTDATTSPTTFKQICSEVESEGGVERDSMYPFSFMVENVDLGIGLVNASPVIAIRHSETFKSRENRGIFTPKVVSIMPTGGRCVAAVLYNATITGGTWSQVDAESLMEVNTTGTLTDNGVTLEHCMSTAGSKNSSGSPIGQSIAKRLPFGLDVDGLNSTVLVIAAYALDSAVSADISFSWEETR